MSFSPLQSYTLTKATPMTCMYLMNLQPVRQHCLRWTV